MQVLAHIYRILRTDVVYTSPLSASKPHPGNKEEKEEQPSILRSASELEALSISGFTKCGFLNNIDSQNNFFYKLSGSNIGQNVQRNLTWVWLVETVECFCHEHKSFEPRFKHVIAISPLVVKSLSDFLGLKVDQMQSNNSMHIKVYMYAKRVAIMPISVLLNENMTLYMTLIIWQF